MENMSTFELETFLKMVLEILNGCKDIEEAREKIKALLERWAGLKRKTKADGDLPTVCDWYKYYSTLLIKRQEKFKKWGRDNGNKRKNWTFRRTS